jgi:hypothetical protein
MGTTGELVLFFREGGFYPVMLSGLKPTADEVPDHVALNPGTTRVETLTGEVIWPPKVTQ